MKILKLTAENVKKLRAVEITPTGELVAITGRNGQGKSSVLDSLWWALAGTKHIQAVPIRQGADKARIRLELGQGQTAELTVERRFTPKGSTLTVENAEGARFTSPQAMLDALLGALTFDPLAFVNEEPREQFDTLRRIVPLEVDVDNLDALNRGDFDRRTDVNREAKQLRAQADGITVPAGLPEAAVDTAALKDAMAAASKTNAEIEGRRARREGVAREVEQLHDAIKAKREEAVRLLAQVKALEAAAEDFNRQAHELEHKLATAEPLPEPVDADALRTQLDQAEAVNAGVAARARKAELVAQAEAQETRSKELTATMAAREQEKARAIAAAPVPVPGLGFGDGIVTFQGIPFAQASTAEQLRVSVAIAMAANPKLRVIRIKEGSLLDAENLALIAEMAARHDYQVWVERVDTSGKLGIYIEDGQVVAVDGERVGATKGAQA